MSWFDVFCDTVSSGFDTSRNLASRALDTAAEACEWTREHREEINEWTREHSGEIGEWACEHREEIGEAIEFAQDILTRFPEISLRSEDSARGKLSPLTLSAIIFEEGTYGMFHFNPFVV